MSKPAFANLWNTFPDHIRYPNLKALYTWLGGAAEKNITQQGFGENGNACASRLSVAFNRSFAPINKSVAASVGATTISAADGSQIIFRIEEFRRYLYKVLGKPMIDKTRPFDSDIFGKKGIIAFRINFGDATGHIALWNGTMYREPIYDNFANFVHQNRPYIRTSASQFWELQ